MRASDFRHLAWDKLKGKWGTLSLTFLIYVVIVSLCSGGFISMLITILSPGLGITMSIIGGILSLVVTGPFTLSFAKMGFNLASGKDVSTTDLFSGFHEFGKAFLLNLIIAIFTFLWTLAFSAVPLIIFIIILYATDSYVASMIFGFIFVIVAAVIAIYKQITYSMSYFVMAENPSIKPEDARKTSMKILKGNVKRLICLHLSFIGWYLLELLTLGILAIVVTPYVITAEAEFYNDLMAKQRENDTQIAKGDDTLKVAEVENTPKETSAENIFGDIDR